MHTHTHSWIYCHSIRLARTASMGEILMGYICLLLRVWKYFSSLVTISKRQVWSWGRQWAACHWWQWGRWWHRVLCTSDQLGMDQIIPPRCSGQAQCIHQHRHFCKCTTLHEHLWQGEGIKPSCSGASWNVLWPLSQILSEIIWPLQTRAWCSVLS